MPEDKVAQALRPLPWQQVLWADMQARKSLLRLPHALLMCGIEGVGKRHFADIFTQALLCTRPGPEGQACQVCDACHWFQAGTHPDYRLLAPAEEGRAILIDQIRELNAYFALKSHHGGYKIAVIEPADSMNGAAANALLKTLEEPAPYTLLLLITQRPSRLPATVRSRCQRLTITPPPAQQALPWLRERLDTAADAALLLTLAGGAPLRALDLAQGDICGQRITLLEDLESMQQGQSDPVICAAAWMERGAASSLEWLYGYIIDMIRLQSVPQPPRLRNPDMRDRLQRIAARIGQFTLYQHLDCAVEGLRLLSTQVNSQVLLEEILVGWAPMTTKPAVA
ncbi:MAG: DNA polymerase III subunit delta' [Gammaproteobacteria bacterium]|nr:DNA polymerase III subunit delta' [Gammaproteobacteria bacterium]